ncbi:Ig-like domain-containing protein [Microbacterium oxydans]|uniref:Ig-like domain-containing protein n=1 Tax=Microbacterium oxydans TaxID=82380 RepID=UPI00362AC6ED
MKTTQPRWLTSAVATLGAGALAIGGAAVPAAADEVPDAPIELQSSATKYELAAAQSGDTAEAIESLEKAGLIGVTDQGFFYYNDQAHSSTGLTTLALPAAPEGAAIPGSAAAGSRPGAPVTVYLDFDGETLEGTHWNTDSGIASLAFAPAALVTNRAAVWAAVAEDYAPFNVNVTTTRPSDDQLYKTSADDNVYGSHVIITDSYDEVLPAAAGNGGIAWLGGTGSEYLSGALVFTEGTGGSPKAIAEIAAHESGHNFGLEHDGISGAGGGEYYAPEDGVWGTIMGAAYYVPVSQWSAGGYAGSTNAQDDLATITDRSAAAAVFVNATLPDGTPYTASGVCVQSGDPSNPQPGDVFFALGVNGDCTPPGDQLTLNFTYRDRADYAADAVGDTAAAAQVLDNADGTFEAANVIERTTDVDVFAVTTAGGALTATVEVADISPNLDAKLTLTDGSGAVLAENDPASARSSDAVATGLGATVTAADLQAGTYYLAVEGVGAGNPATATALDANGYAKYGSLGNYTLSGAAEAFDSEPLVIETPTDGSAVTGGEEIEVTGTATPNATVTLSVGGTVVDTVTADENGDWTGTVTANEFGNTEIVAAQTVGTIVIPGTTSVTVVAPAAPIAAPVITAPATGSTTDDSTPTISGTGVAGAVVTVTIRSADGAVTTAQATVAENGTWSVTVTAALANGTYTATAVQNLGTDISESSGAVTFTIEAAPGTGGGGSDDNLASTGMGFDATPIAGMAVVLLLVGGGIVLYARRKSLSLEG